jgi:colicin import membrane protein
MAALNPLIRDRIIASAEALYNAGGRTKLPTVGAVRRHSNTSMSDSCDVMQEWRALQTTPASAPTAEIPDRVLQASTALIRELWKEAQTNANESVVSAQSSWDKARAEMLQIREEANADFELVRTETEGLHAQLAAAEAQTTADASSASKAISDERERSASLKEQAQIALARIAEIEKRADDLRVASNDAQDRAHSLKIELDMAREELSKLRRQSEFQVSELASLKAETTERNAAKQAADERLAQVEKELQDARIVAAMAREHTAILVGKCQVLEGQQVEWNYSGTAHGKRAASKQVKKSEREKAHLEK